MVAARRRPPVPSAVSKKKRDGPRKRFNLVFRPAVVCRDLKRIVTAKHREYLKFRPDLGWDTTKPPEIRIGKGALLGLCSFKTAVLRSLINDATDDGQVTQQRLGIDDLNKALLSHGDEYRQLAPNMVRLAQSNALEEQRLNKSARAINRLVAKAKEEEEEEEGSPAEEPPKKAAPSARGRPKKKVA